MKSKEESKSLSFTHLDKSLVTSLQISRSIFTHSLEHQKTLPQSFYISKTKDTSNYLHGEKGYSSSGQLLKFKRKLMKYLEDQQKANEKLQAQIKLTEKVKQFKQIKQKNKIIINRESIQPYDLKHIEENFIKRKNLRKYAYFLSKQNNKKKLEDRNNLKSCDSGMTKIEFFPQPTYTEPIKIKSDNTSQKKQKKSKSSSKKLKQMKTFYVSGAKYPQKKKAFQPKFNSQYFQRYHSSKEDDDPLKSEDISCLLGKTYISKSFFQDDIKDINLIGWAEKPFKSQHATVIIHDQSPQPEDFTNPHQVLPAKRIKFHPKRIIKKQIIKEVKQEGDLGPWMKRRDTQIEFINQNIF